MTNACVFCGEPIAGNFVYDEANGELACSACGEAEKSAQKVEAMTPESQQAALPHAEEGLRKMLRAYKRGTGCHLTWEQVYELGMTPVAEIWDRDAAASDREAGEPIL